MRDSRTGAMGVVGVVFVLLGKYAALSSMDVEMLCLTVFFMPLVGRCAIVFVMATQQYARKEGGLATLFYSGKSKKAALSSVVILFLALAVLAPDALLIMPVTLFSIIFLFVRLCNAKLGGATGDTLGATCEIAELLTAFTFTALI
jgi:adenosylcobinamide-GDP ribazoletransferase